MRLVIFTEYFMYHYIVVFDSDLVIVTLVTSNIMMGTQTNYIILSAKVIEIIC